MKLKEITELAMAANVTEFDGVNAGRASKMVASVLKIIAKQVGEMDEGRIAVPGLGVFVIKQIEREKDGNKTKVKRVLFRIPQAK